MPRLPDETQLGTATPNPSLAVVDGPRDNTPAAIARLGSTVSQIGAQIEERRSRLEYQKAKSGLLQAQIEAEKEIEDGEWETYVPRYQEKMRKARGELSKGLYGFSKEQFDTEADLAIERGVFQVAGKARLAENDAGLANLTEIITRNRELALNSTSEAQRSAVIQDTNEAIDLAVQDGYFGENAEQKAAKLRQSFAEDYATSSISMLDYAEQIKRLEGNVKGSSLEFIPSDKRAIMLRNAKQKVQQGKAEQQYALSGRIQDAVAAYEQGMSYDNAPSLDELEAAYGKVKGQDIYRGLEKAQQFGADVHFLFTATPEEQAKLLAERDPAKKVAQGGFAEDSKRFGQLVNALQNIEKQKQNDPATFINKHNPEIEATFQAAMQLNTPEALTAYANKTLAEQERLGIDDPKLLPANYVAAINQELGNTEEGGENAYNIMTDMAQKWGRNWPTVYKQLSKSLGPVALVVGSGVEPRAGETLARIANISTAELKKGLGNGDSNDIQRNLRDAFAEFNRTTSVQGAEAISTAFYDQAYRLSLQYMKSGQSPSEASENAYQDLIGKKYTFHGSYRVPREYDGGRIEDNAETALEEIDLSSVVLNVPRPSGVTESFYRKELEKAVRKDGYWVTNDEETGLTLYLGGAAVESEDGPLSLTWEDLLSINPMLNRDFPSL